jgi:hypothetical protein
MWRRWLWLFPSLFVALSSAAVPDAHAQPDCADASLLEAGHWRGSFEVSWTARWTADLEVPRTGLGPAPATWEHTQTVAGEVDLFVAESAKGDAPLLSGAARARFQTRSRAMRDDGASARLFSDLRLSGGTFTASSGRMLVSGETVEWLGATLTGDFASSSVSFYGADGRGLLVGDGIPIRHPVEPIRFQVQAADCREISGVVEGLGFDRSWLEPGAGLAVATPTLGAAIDLTVLSERATFQLAGPSPEP